MGVNLNGLSSPYAAYGPSDFRYILVVIETTQTYLDSGSGFTQTSVAAVLMYQCTHGISMFFTII